jgi:toxin ParE1/3/4
MEYLVEITSRAVRDLENIYNLIQAGDTASAGRWFNGLEAAIHTLERFPHRCPLAPENKKTRRPLRHLLHGRKPNVYRILYEIDQRKRMVRILTIRHGAMDEFEH